MRVRSWLATVVGLVTLVACGGSSSTPSGDEIPALSSLKGRKLVVASYGGVWAAATKKYFVDPFAAASGVNVTMVEIGFTYAPQLQQQEQANQVQWDIIDGSDPSDVIRLDRLGYIQHYPQSLLDHIQPLIQPSLKLTELGLPYGQGGQTIACNPALVKACPSTPQEFFDVTNFPGPRELGTTPWLTLAYALEGDGVAPDKLFPMDLNRAVAKLKSIRSSIKALPQSTAQSQQLLIDKEVGIAMPMPNGRAYTLKARSMPNLAISWTGSIESGGILALPKNGPNKDVALAYIQWLVDHPQSQADWSKTLTYSTPTKDLVSLLPSNIAEQLPAAHQQAVPDYGWIADHNSDVQAAWQSFVTGG